MRSVIAENTKRIIASKGVKNRAIAAKAGLSEKQFSALLNHRRLIKDTDVMAIAEALEVTPNDLFGLSSKNSA